MIIPEGRKTPRGRRISRLLRAALAVLLLAAAPARLPAETAPGSGELVVRAGRIFGTEAAAPAWSSEDLTYEVRAGLLGVLGGQAHWTLRRGEEGGRTVLRVRQEAVVSGRRQVTEALLDAAGRFPLEYTRSTGGPAEEVHIDTVLWDHLGGRLFCESRVERDGTLISVRDRQERRLGDQVDADVMDPLSALLVYRLRTADQGSAEAWTVPVIEGCDEIWTCAFTPRGPATLVRGKDGERWVAVVEQIWTARGSGREKRKGDLSLELDHRCVPIAISGTVWGIAGSLTLTDRREE